VKLFSLKNFTLSLNEAPKAHYCSFLLLIQSSAVQQKSNKATLPNTKTCSTLKLAFCVQSRPRFENQTFWRNYSSVSKLL